MIRSVKSKTGQGRINNKQVLVGTANFGQGYGLCQTGRGLSEKDLEEIFSAMELVPSLGFDTSPDYGTSEVLLGQRILQIGLKRNITTKVPKVCYSSPEMTLTSVKTSLENLNLNSVNTVLFHGFSDEFIEFADKLRESSEKLLNLGLASNVGLSCYTEEEVLRGKELVPSLTVFQVPENIIDQRLRNSQQIQELSEEDCTFYLRSIFLQGRLLAIPGTLPAESEEWKGLMKSIDDNASANGLSRIAYCVAYAKLMPWASGIVVGVNSAVHLREVLLHYSHDYSSLSFDLEKGSLDLIDPRRWEVTK
jgi:aryl-alcohol dehydrogenase-like predicted oxidoreductase